MKAFVFGILFLMLYKTTLCQTLTLRDTVNVDTSLSQSMLYNNAKTWILKNYQSAKEVIQYDDKEAGRLSFRGHSKIDVPYNFYNGIASAGSKDCWYTVTLEFKKSKWRYTIDNIGVMDDPLPQDPPKGFGHKAKLPYRETCIKEMQKLIDQMKGAFIKKEDNNW